MTSSTSRPRVPLCAPITRLACLGLWPPRTWGSPRLMPHHKPPHPPTSDSTDMVRPAGSGTGWGHLIPIRGTEVSGTVLDKWIWPISAHSTSLDVKDNLSHAYWPSNCIGGLWPGLGGILLNKPLFLQLAVLNQIHIKLLPA